MQAVSFAVLPNTGLGNKLFVWARATAFGYLNGLDTVAVGWSWPKIGPLLRGEQRDILYGRWLNTEPLLYRLNSLAKIFLMQREYEPPLAPFDVRPDTVYVFTKIPHWGDHFGSFQSARSHLISAFRSLVHPSIVTTVCRHETPIVAVHIRRGDFRELPPNQNFAEVGSIRTPLEYFTDVISNIRVCARWPVPITVYSDGTASELAPLLALDDVRRAQNMRDVGHLLSMARAKLIVASAGSTFSLWAGFLSQAAIILHPDHIHARIRPVESGLYEGPAVGTCSNWDQTLIDKIRSLAGE
jgi:hypothetical protein